jgi:AcrR family transcriptional regulator
VIPPDLTRRERRKLEVRGRILEAAVELFDAQGVAETKVSEICERADVAHKTFFNHFPSRQQLIREIAHEALASMLARIEEVTKLPVPARQRLEIYFGGIAEEADEAGPMARDLLTEIIHAGHEEGPEHARKIHDAFERMVRAGVDAGDVDARHGIDTLTEMVMGAYYALMFNWAHLEGYPLRRQALAAARFLGHAMSSTSERSES